MKLSPQLSVLVTLMLRYVVPTIEHSQSNSPIVLFDVVN